jgi:hypothetical protein
MLLFFPSPTGSNSLLKQFWRLLRNPPGNSNFPYPVFSESNFYAGGRTTARPEISVRRLELLVARRLQSNPTEKDLAEGGASRSRKSRPVISTPIIFYYRRATCWQPYVKGLTIMVNSIANGARMEGVWLDK